MKVVAIESEYWFFSNQDELRPVRGIPLIDFVRGIGARYSFCRVPTTIPEGSQGLVFEEGEFSVLDRRVQIKRLEIYQDGVHLYVASDTNDVDALWDDLRVWYASVGGRSTVTPTLDFHISNIVCDFESNIDSIISGFNAIRQMISGKLDVSSDVHSLSLSFSADPSLLRDHLKLNPTVFRIERRVHIEFSKNRYFSMANMTTAKHIEMLQWLEEYISAQL